MLKFKNYSYSISSLEKRIQSMASIGIGRNNDLSTLRSIMGLLDLTTLEGSDTEDKAIELCDKALAYKSDAENVPGVAAICVYPTLVRIVRERLAGTGIHTASVAGAFPSGQTALSIKIMETRFAINEGAEEIDLAISRGRFLQGDYDYVYGEIAQIREVCKDIFLKVILETGELQTVKNIRKASEMAINAGADFIKTSTGKIQPAATPLAVTIILDTIKEYYDITGRMVGIKPSGGISTIEQAMTYYVLVLNLLGENWIKKDHFRIGTSRLADQLIKEIQDNTV